MCINHWRTAVDYAVLFWYCGTIKYCDIWVIVMNSFVTLHNTTLYYFLFYVCCQDMCLHSYGVTAVHRQCKVLFIYPLINLFNKKTTQNRYTWCFIRRTPFCFFSWFTQMMINLHKICTSCGWRNSSSKYCNRIWQLIKYFLLVLT